MAKIDEDLSRMSIGDDSNNKFGRNKIQRDLEIYRPGSGPLRRSGISRQDGEDERSAFSSYGRDHDSGKKSDFIPNKHFENPNRKKENFGRGQSKMNGFAADNYSTFNLRRKQQKKNQPFYEPQNEWSESSKRPDRPRVNFVHPDDSKDDDDENWRTHKTPKIVITPKMIKKPEVRPPIEKPVVSFDNIPSMVINTRVNPMSIQNTLEKVSSYGGVRKDKKPLNKTSLSSILMTYEKLPPRFRKKYCVDNHITIEEVESYLTNGIPPSQDEYKVNSSCQSRSQTLPQRSSSGKFNEPPKQPDQVFYRNSNQPPKSEVRRTQSMHQSMLDHNKRINKSVDHELTGKSNNEFMESKREELVNDRIDESNNCIKQTLESAVLLPSGTINWAEEVERAENLSKVAEDTKKDAFLKPPDTVERNQNYNKDRKQINSLSKERNAPLSKHDQVSSIGNSKWHSNINENSERQHCNSNWRSEKSSKSNRNCSNDRSRNRSKNRRNRHNSEKSASQKRENIAGIIKLPPNVSTADPGHLSLNGYLNNKSLSTSTPQLPCPAKQLFNPNNPNKPIVIASKQQNTRVGYVPPAVDQHTTKDYYVGAMSTAPVQHFSGAHFGNPPPSWYDPYTESYRSSRHPVLLLDIKKADSIMEDKIFGSNMLSNWHTINSCREFLKDALKELLKTDMKFCQRENVETHFWKILYHNIIEQLKKLINEDSPELSKDYTTLLMNLIEEGMKYMNDLLKLLEKTYSFNLDDYMSLTCLSTKKLGNIGLALISSQKLYISLGDLARYKDIMNHSTNYVIAKQWYTKANLINPKNGRPYNQLALLAVYEKRKLDAVYYYMRSLMASNPFQSAKDSLLSLFEEYRRKYEMTDRKRQEDREKRERDKAKEKESSMSAKEKYSKRRKEIWIHPDGGKRSHRTTSTTEPTQDIDEEELSKLSQSEVNKRFIVSFLHVHGKLFTKVGMETFQDTALQMLREFRKLLSNTPIPIITTRFLQYLALNMFAIEYSRPKDTHVEQGYWSTMHECALVMSLQMFSLIVDRCNQLLKELLVKNEDSSMAKHLIGSDIDFLLPPIKVWCDWLLRNSKVWNPPPSCSDYKLSGSGDCWSRLASLVNNLEKFQEQYKLFLNEADEKDPNTIQLKLPEDSMFSGFTPIIGYELKPAFIHSSSDRDLSEFAMRVNCILFFGTEFLCGTEPPVFKLHKTDTGASEYISVVETASSKDESEDEDLCVESWSDEEHDQKSKPLNKTCLTESSVKPLSNEIQKLLSRKEELEQKQRNEELRQKRVQEILRQASYCVEIEIKPHYIVPDTNCFVDYLPQLEKLMHSFSHAQEHTCTIMVPNVVLIELEGLAKGGWARESVSNAAKQALKTLKNVDTASVKFVTTKGSSFKSSTSFEEDSNIIGNNDDKILTTCLSLCKHNVQGAPNYPQSEDEPKKIYRDVVLLTEDRNLRVKALSSDVPVRAIMDFINWLNFNNS